MNNIRITVIRKIHHADLSARYENPIEHACSMKEGEIFISKNGEKPEGLCAIAQPSMKHIVRTLASGW